MIVKQLRAILQHCPDEMPIEVWVPSPLGIGPGEFREVKEAKYFREMPDSQRILMVTLGEQT